MPSPLTITQIEALAGAPVLTPYVHGNSVQTGCTVTPAAAANGFAVDMASGTATILGLAITPAAQAGLPVAPPSNDGAHRLDLVVVDGSGRAFIVAGATSNLPRYPTPPYGTVPVAGLAIQSVIPAQTVITSSQIADKRPIR